MRQFFILRTLLFGVLLIVPSLSFAAYNDVTLTTDTVITVGGINLTVSGSSAIVESITVDTDSFSFTMPSNASSTLQVSSSDRRVLYTNSPAQYITKNECSSSASVLEHTFSGLAPITVGITPQTSTCGNNATSAVVPSSSSSSGGGGGGIAPAGLINPTPPSTVAQNAAIAVTKVPTPQVSTAPAPAPTVPATSFSGSKTLRSGMIGSDVKLLQQLLNKVGIVIAQSGAGSPGYETNRFGALTEKAVQKFQTQYGIVSSGTPDTTGYGLVGPKTRAKLLEVAGASPSVEPSAPVSTPTPTAGAVSAVFSKPLSPGATHTDVKRLQQLLNTDPDTRISESGVGSPGNETLYFGSLTTKAIQKFQMKYGVASSGDAGYGSFGPKTRAKLQEVFGR